MVYHVDIKEAEELYPEYRFISALTPSAQKAAFHVQDGDGSDLCLKLIAPYHDIDRVTREIESLQDISHPNVVRHIEYTYSIRRGRRIHHILEEFIDGRDLGEVLANAPLGLEATKKLFLPLLSGLETIAESEIVHRDLKPANVRVRSDGQPVIIDFGLARRLRDPDLTHTSQGAAIGTPAYFAPEQFQGEKRDIDPRTDLFATGILIYQALLGRHPFYEDGMTYADTKDAICASDKPFHLDGFEKLPSTWGILLKRLLAKDRVGRPASPKEARALLEQAEEKQS